eukprot:CAMPEP_0179187896 /NCGR_PEP_ID=MMETSP0796-20121207/93244_1 /TAXON_ID=73915 /ORGANISM="Pyrodinium bahamense, Strain pbaha01" /LENGTH=66 /DNA_ID=CAMNT_0020891977 /DNA_START=16 /DNA_END=212 /DNA_ORIENTATION=+
MSTISVSSFSSAAKAAASFARIKVAALRSASSTERLPESSSILAFSEPMVAVSLAIEALSSAAPAS